jgi:hypothetical protein
MTGSGPRKSAGKKTAHASEQERSDVQAARAVWRKRQAWLLSHPGRVGNIVFIDETGINTKMARLRGRCPRGQRTVAPIPHGHWKTLTFIAGLRHDGLTAPWVIDGPMTANIFETYIETQLVPTLTPGDVVILDNLSSHKSAKAAQDLKAAGAWFVARLTNEVQFLYDRELQWEQTIVSSI